MPEDRVAIHMALMIVSRDPPIELIDGQSATRRQRAMIARVAILAPTPAGKPARSRRSWAHSGTR